MPNISMCGSSTCPKRMSCYRNQASGTQPSQGRQSWMYFAKDGEPCDSYWPTELGRHIAARNHVNLTPTEQVQHDGD
jgi:hypothetical protein